MKVNKNIAVRFLIFISICGALIIISTSLAHLVKHEQIAEPPLGSAENKVHDSPVLASTDSKTERDNATTAINDSDDPPVVMPVSDKIKSTVRDFNKNTTIESEGLTCTDAIKQRLRVAIKEAPAKKIAGVDIKSIGSSETLPANTKKSAALPFATIGSSNPR